jgi:YcaO-like protein with predicted kinase domain
MFEITRRPYKSCSANETIKRIKSILQPLDLLPHETYHANPYPEIYSMRLELDNEKGCFGTNGKGRTEEYSCASGYAEFLERMQNGLYAIFPRTLIKTLHDEYHYYYSPDEGFLSEKDFYQLPKGIIADVVRQTGENKENFVSAYFDRVRANGSKGVVSVPFYDTMKKCEVHLPLNLLLLTVGSNGMAAGNTRAEAIFQAICELTERWGAAEVFYGQLTPPTIPDDYLKGLEEEYAIIKHIEKSGKYKLTVKDFSAGKSIPAVGLIVTRLETQQYRLNVGSDSSFQVALSRCLTEVYQGFKNENDFDARLLDMPREKLEFFENDDEDAMYHRYCVFGEFTKDNSGVFPPSLFGSEESYAFDPKTFTTTSSYESEVSRIIENFHKNSYNVYIRDAGFLGFPAVFVYIPEISALGRKNAPARTKTETFNIIELDKIEPLLFDLENCSPEDFRQIATTLESFDAGASVLGLLSINLAATSIWQNITVSFLTTQIWYRLGELQKARRAYKSFLETRKEENPYYDLAGKFLDLKIEGLSNTSIQKEMLRENNNKRLVEEVFADLSHPEDIFQHIKLPQCPRCESCRLNDDCLTTSRLSIAHKLYPIMKNHIIDQKSLSWIPE